MADRRVVFLLCSAPTVFSTPRQMKLSSFFISTALMFLMTKGQGLFNTGTWTWLSGSSGTNQAGIYGIRNVANDTNVPGARYGHCIATDISSNVLYLFGGRTTAETNDLWVYNITTDVWTWISGSSTTSAAASYGTQFRSTNVPGARSVHSMVFHARENSLYVFGGYGRDATLTGHFCLVSA
jgi:hypothetical protein